MNTSTTIYSKTGFALFVLIFGNLIALPEIANAKQETVAVDGAGYNVTTSLSNNLRLYKGKKVTLTLDSGKTMAGTVKDVGDQLVHLEKIEGKEYFDALIRIDSINSIDARFRTYKR